VHLLSKISHRSPPPNSTENGRTVTSLSVIPLAAPISKVVGAPTRQLPCLAFAKVVQSIVFGVTRVEVWERGRFIVRLSSHPIRN
jgi:hypothetical protein